MKFIFLSVFLLHRIVICLSDFPTSIRMFLKKKTSYKFYFWIIVILTDRNFCFDCCSDFIIFVFKLMYWCILLIFIVKGPYDTLSTDSSLAEQVVWETTIFHWIQVFGRSGRNEKKLYKGTSLHAQPKIICLAEWFQRRGFSDVSANQIQESYMAAMFFCPIKTKWGFVTDALHQL